MAHWAQIDENNMVTNVVVMDNEHADGREGYSWLVATLGGRWAKTSYNTHAGEHLLGGAPLRKNYATIGGTYDEARDAFIPPKGDGLDSWILNEETCQWEAPIPKPDDGGDYVWDEEAGDWVEVTDETF